MPRDHDSEACRFRLQIQLSQVVQHKNGNTGELENFRLCQFARPRCCVDVAADGGHGRDGCELLKNLRRAHIPGVNDVF